MIHSFELTEAANYYYAAVKELKAQAPDSGDMLPGNACFINDTDVACLDRDFGVSRQPYYADGLTMWCRSSGYVSVQEGQNTVFRFIRDGEEPCIAFYAGFPDGEGRFIPVSVTGVAKSYKEPDGVERFSVFTPAAAYYFTEYEGAVVCLRAFVTEDKQMVLSAAVTDKSGKDRQIYLAAYIDPLLRYMENEDFESRWFKSSEYIVEDGFILHSSLDSKTYLGIGADFQGEVGRRYRTTARTMVTGKSDECLARSHNLIRGDFADCMYKSSFKDNSVAGEILHFSIPAGGSVRADYRMKMYSTYSEAVDYINAPLSAERLDNCVAALAEKVTATHSNMTLSFEGELLGKTDRLVNRFIESVKRQAYFCAMGKNYCGPKIGMRDVYQQLEPTTYWCPEESGERLVKYLDYISPEGRTPRQITVTQKKDEIPPYDTREFVDQGLWIITSFHTYLSYTGDYDILDKTCGYYEFDDAGVIRRSDRVDTVLDHLFTIMGYLENNLDKENTGCLRALYGDWNDALDGLGRTTDKDKKFGSGVSVMGTLQYYGNLLDMEQILRVTGKRPDMADKYAAMAEKLAKDIMQYAVTADEAGHRRVLHGWGDKRQFFVGGFIDCDGLPRDSLAVNAYFVLSGMYAKNPDMKEHILAAMSRLDSRYGLKTFEPFFAEDVQGVGRIIHLPPGTAENSCAYIHASLFGIMALFKMGKSQQAWEQLAKSVVITHDRISSTSYVMPNSWCHNSELGIDGESMSDWHTGSGAVLLKILVGYAFGIQPDLKGVNIRFPAFIPTASAEARVPVRGKTLVLRYENKGAGERSFEYGGKKFDATYDPVLDGPTVSIPYGDLEDGAVLKITD